MNVLVTGSAGFIGRHVLEALSRRPDTIVHPCDLDTPPGDLERALAVADVIIHLAGINRPQDPAEFRTGNTDLTVTLTERLQALGRRPLFLLSSSIQAALDNPYGVSKRLAEEAVSRWAAATGARAVVFRLKNVFGKWCRPNYNSVTATFCHNVARDLALTISDPARELELVYIDDVVRAFLSTLDAVGPAGAGTELPPAGGIRFGEVTRSFRTTLGELAARIRSFRESRSSLRLPEFSDDFTRCLYATYLSYLDGADFAYSLERKTDARGSLAEFLKSPAIGQIFVSRTLPGVTRGNHYHHTKTEKFLVLEGEAVIRLRLIGGSEVIEHRVNGTEFRVVDIPPGHTHSIENVGTGELVTLFWASEIFDPARPDTFFQPVLPAQESRPAAAG